ncbi:MAG TPA: hypothetical protein VHE35_10780 [Kofleriaceae bacterium]|nr:hypothetical protein [Kofleriaceae bacterium]
MLDPRRLADAHAAVRPQRSRTRTTELLRQLQAALRRADADGGEVDVAGEPDRTIV